VDIDERIQALTVNVESLHASTHELYEASRRHDFQIEQMRKDAEQTRKDADARMAKLEEYSARMMQSITRLSNVATVHNIQIGDHEQRISDLEKPR
jgi:chromosome segregation ATPase